MNKTKISKIVLAVSLALGGGGVSQSALANAGQNMVNPTGGILEGYWHNWCNVNGGDGYQRGASACMQLKDIHHDYNVVMIAFMKVFEGQKGHIPTFQLDTSLMSEQEFKTQISDLNAQGRSVLLSLGGADAHIEFQHGDEDEFAEEIIRLVELYGFDGLDIDLEQAAITAGENEYVIVEALKTVKAHYQEQGKNFIIAMAPEFPHLRGVYNNYIESLDGYYDWISPQFYNQGGDGVNGDGTGQCGWWIAQDKDECREEFIYTSAYNISQGLDGFIKIPHDKLVYGIPANKDAAATGQVKNPQDLFNAFADLASEGLALRGIMTWSINWDMGKDSTNIPYNSQFVNTYGPFIHDGNGDTPPVISGTQDVVISINTPFDEMNGVTASDREDGDLTKSIIHQGTVIETQAGVYTISYQVTDSGNNQTDTTRLVTVTANGGTEGSKPEIHGVEDTTSVLGQAFDSMLSVSAMDNEDGNITSQVLVEGSVNTTIEASNVLTYRVTDNDDNETVKVRNVDVINEAPELGGIENVTIAVGETFNPRQGVTASDSTDGDLTSEIEIEGNVDTNIADIYTLNYSVADHNGLITSLNRNITINEQGQCGDVNEYPNWPSKDWEGGEYNHANTGDLMSYENVVYEAQWYTTSIPGSDESWVLVDDCQTDGNLAPTAIIEGPTTAKVDEEIILNGESSSDEDGTIVSYQWTWNGNPVTNKPSEPNLNLNFDEQDLGENVFTLTVTDDEGKDNSVEHTVIVTSDDGGPEPGTCDGIPTYQAYEPATGNGIYMTGDIVAHEGNQYESLTDNLYNVEPGTADHWWKPLGACQ